MCGIAGKVLFDSEATVCRGLLERMSAALSHRGPDDTGLHVEPMVGFAHRRLSIIDLATGRQPLANEDRTVWVMLNGEIYNYVELQRELMARGHRFRSDGDGEVIAHLYEELGAGFVERLRGMFAIALWDSRQRCLLLVRDRLGKKPLYYSALPGKGLVFASEIKALLEDPEVRRDVDPVAIDAYLSLQYVPAPRSAFTSVRKLPPAHLLHLRDGQIRLRRYWDLHYAGAQPRSADDYAGELEARLREAVRLRLRSDVPVGAFLSGGIDSTAMVAFMAELSPQAVVACSVGFEDPEHDELAHARRVARDLGCTHHEHVVELEVETVLPKVARAFDEPFADPAALPTYVLSEIARRHVKVAISGDGGDELFAGYWRHRRDRLERRLRAALGRRGVRVLLALSDRLAPARVREGLRQLGMSPELAYAWKHCGLYFTGPGKAALYTADLAGACRGYDPADLLQTHYRRCEAADPVDKALYVDLLTCLPDDLLVKLDRSSMAHGLEVRSPLLDHELVQFAATVPASLKLRGGRQKELLRRALGRRVSAVLLRRPKHGFTVPLARWLRGPLRVLAEDCLLGSRSSDRGLFRPSGVRALWTRFLAGEARLAHRLWILLMLELWQREYVDRSPVP